MDHDMRCAPHSDRSTAEQRKALKFEVQVYRVRTHNYLIDIQRLEGHLYLFLDLCSELISQLNLDALPAPPPLESAPPTSHNGGEFMAQH